MTLMLRSDLAHDGLQSQETVVYHRSVSPVAKNVKNSELKHAHTYRSRLTSFVSLNYN